MSRETGCLPVRCSLANIPLSTMQQKQTACVSRIFCLALRCTGPPFLPARPQSQCVQTVRTSGWAQTMQSPIRRSERRESSQDIRVPLTTEQKPIPQQGPNVSQICPPLSNSTAPPETTLPLIPLLSFRFWNSVCPRP